VLLFVMSALTDKLVWIQCYADAAPGLLFVSQLTARDLQVDLVSAQLKISNELECSYFVILFIDSRIVIPACHVPIDDVMCQSASMHLRPHQTALSDRFASSIHCWHIKLCLPIIAQLLLIAKLSVASWQAKPYAVHSHA